MSGSPKTISLVLGSGGARGHAHLGVIKAIEERGHKIRNIAGTSIFKGERIFEVLKDLIGDRNVEDLDRGLINPNPIAPTVNGFSLPILQSQGGH